MGKFPIPIWFRNTQSRFAMPLGFVIWVGAVSAGATVLWKYGSSAGASLTAPTYWPKNSLLQTTPGQPTLVMILHPKCPCSRASVAELSRLLVICRIQPAVRILIVKPDGAPDGFEQTDLINNLASLPNVKSVVDESGEEANRFGALTSGTVLLFAANGALLFNGGITSARGHEGDNAGRSALRDILNGDVPLTKNTPVYGCPVFTTPPEVPPQ